MKKVLLTGASGFIGRHAIDGLKKRGYEIHAISRRCFEDEVNVHWYNVDLFDSSKVKQLFEQVKPSHLLHLAWNVDPKTYVSSIDNFRWVRVSLELLEFFKENGGVRTVFAGSCAEYDWRYGWLSEDLTPAQPSSNYGICKHSLNKMVNAFCQSNEISSAWGRMFFLYGPHEAESRLVSSIVKALLKGKPALCTSGEQYRDFMYVEDVADAFCELLDSEVNGSVNIASGEMIKISELVQRIAFRIGKPELLKIGAIEARDGDPLFLGANTARLATEVGWKPKFTLESGIERTIRWWSDYLRLTGER